MVVMMELMGDGRIAKGRFTSFYDGLEALRVFGRRGDYVIGRRELAIKTADGIKITPLSGLNERRSK